MTDTISSLTTRLHANDFSPVQIAVLQDAFTYIDRVQQRFTNHPELLERFNDIVRAFGAAAGGVEVETVVRRVSELFVEHPEWVEGFGAWVEAERLARRGEEDDDGEGAVMGAEGSGGGGGGGAERDDVADCDVTRQSRRERTRTSRRRPRRGQASGDLVLERPPQNAFQAHLLRDPLLPLPAGIPSPWLRRLHARHSGDRAIWVDYRSGVTRTGRWRLIEGVSVRSGMGRLPRAAASVPGLEEGLDGRAVRSLETERLG
ncbi:hypothetical protein LTR91_013823 [Friedmanniomyces endolithicus]|uniref:PAH2 domain-containing protein n=1 Tax=Friedmanniomyces endolithicus TaxID=329885 RepID=A0AAN6KCX0_9PEZI|nr:hypothetical protein LTR57_016268 [Friedmanniomyces endolithicus]KAK0975920.1 hypothetical protein LTR91_013823 [Friedmanniomyces endolithicus]KAK0979235.1 hypothetical protein LTS01_012458 [Friedmanniomyces endolithicus]KAK1033199.1 hypothetical protein LTS16_016535 [Friedmanniomyces endolithicus]